jgi:hypothetical protein
MLAPIIQAPSRKHILKNDIWEYSAAGRFVRIIQAPKRNSKLHNEMWRNPFLPRAFWRAVRVRDASRGFDERHARFL